MHIYYCTTQEVWLCTDCYNYIKLLMFHVFLRMNRAELQLNKYCFLFLVCAFHSHVNSINSGVSKNFELWPRIQDTTRSFKRSKSQRSSEFVGLCNTEVSLGFGPGSTPVLPMILVVFVVSTAAVVALLPISVLVSTLVFMSVLLTFLTAKKWSLHTMCF